MFDHIGVVVSDFAKSKAFYAEALAPIGHSRVVEIMVDGGLKPSAGFLPFVDKVRSQAGAPTGQPNRR